ncbi:ESCO1/2 acetyl-transferase-domain-containing protein [Ampelomyces quisqualis]|uniref:ESCO1/2 acetyl-transferase-domain-containing protein n=1 Tax=Ampelomyces quisqualis TaxID=50730 RepID=A0A6A5R0I2_AMPQU|nr:ESCO1/2 acetyl-transferase-domain-containing protein [Ampelomyces quisqualis]
MASLPTKKIVRTYARQKRSLYDGEPPAKRRRVENADATVEATSSATQSEAATIESITPLESYNLATSSPKGPPAIWSDEAPRSSPPSSPAPTSSPPPIQKRRAVFAVFRKQSKPKIETKRPLTERSHNAQSPPRPLPPTKSRRMVQMQLDLASESRKTCKTCGMEYIPSNAEDFALHRKFHAMNIGGVDFTKATVEQLRKKQVWSGGDGSFIAVVGRKDTLALRNRTRDVLKVVNTELGAVTISDEELWSQIRTSDAGNAPLSDATETDRSNAQSRLATVDRFKTYVYIRGQKCIGACLTERIWEAHTVLAQDDASAQPRQLPFESKSSSISISAESTRALLGISRIWTSNQHRMQGIATTLLDCARSEFLYGLTVEKDEVAFSQPTESGGNLARRWHGREHGWRVYID